MTFLKKDIDNISIIADDDWIYHDEDRTFSVMIHGLEDYATRFFGVDLVNEYPDGWVDTYAVINPVKKTVTDILFVLKTNDDGEDDNRDIDICIGNLPEQRDLYDAIEKAARKSDMDFGAAVEDFVNQAHSDKMETIGCFVDIFDDFLEARGIRIPTSDDEMKRFGDWEDDGNGNNTANAARIYGEDYDDLATKIEDLLDEEVRA